MATTTPPQTAAEPAGIEHLDPSQVLAAVGDAEVAERRAGLAYVDAQVAARIDSCGAVLIDRTIAHAAAKFDPEAQGEAERAGKACWDVRLLTRTDGGFAGTSHLDATGETADLTRFYDLVCDQAAHLARLGDTDPLGARKAKARWSGSGPSPPPGSRSGSAPRG